MQIRSRVIFFTHDLATARSVTDVLGRQFDVVHTRDPGGFESLARQEPPPAALLVDNAVKSLNPIELLQKLRAIRPQARRILLSDYCDIGLIVQGLHTGTVQQIVYSPVHPAELLAALGITGGAGTVATPVPARVTGHTVS